MQDDLAKGTSGLTPWILGIFGVTLLGLGKIVQPRLAAMLKSQEDRVKQLDKERLERIKKLEAELAVSESETGRERDRRVAAEQEVAVLEARVEFLQPQER